MLKRGQTVVIFPEGTRKKGSKAKRGVSVLARQNNVLVIPVSIEKRWPVGKKIRVGEAMDMSDYSPEKVMQTIRNLR